MRVFKLLLLAVGESLEVQGLATCSRKPSSSAYLVVIGRNRRAFHGPAPLSWQLELQSILIGRRSQPNLVPQQSNAALEQRYTP